MANFINRCDDSIPPALNLLRKYDSKNIEKYGFAATSVVMGVKMIYIPMMPNHGKRLPQTMVKLLKPSTGQQYADLMVMFEGDGEEDVGGPPVRYFF